MQGNFSFERRKDCLTIKQIADKLNVLNKYSSTTNFNRNIKNKGDAKALYFNYFDAYWLFFFKII